MQTDLINSNQQAILQQVKDCIAKASLYFNQTFTLPDVSFKQGGKIAGSARLQSNSLRFNPVLLADNVATFLSDVVPHEVSHLLTYQLYGRVKPHGREWQSIMIKVFNCRPSAYHKMDVSKVDGKKFSYKCLCGPVELSIRRHNKVIKNKQQYRCLKCKTQLKAA